MAEIEIPSAAVEGYLHAVADALESAGYTLPSALPYTLHEGEQLIGTITVLGALPDSDDLGLVWDQPSGWQAGYLADGGAIGCLTELLLDAAPPPQTVVDAVRRISQSGDLETGVSENAGPHGVQELLAYEVPDLVQAGADAITARARRLMGRPVEPANANGPAVMMVRPIVAAVWAKVRDRVTSVERLRAELDERERRRAEAVDRLLGDLTRRRAEFHAMQQSAEDGWAEAARLRAELEQRRHDLGERLRAVPGEPWGELLAKADRGPAALKDAMDIASRNARQQAEAEAERDDYKRQLDQARKDESP